METINTVETVTRATLTHLGKEVEYPKYYNPSILEKEPRKYNRQKYNIDPDIFFGGYDVWNCWEFSWLLSNGAPLNGVLKITYDCNNDHIVESKSLKLYLNSFAMTKIDATHYATSVQMCIDMIEKDLSDLLSTKVTATILSLDEYNRTVFKANDSGFFNIDLFAPSTRIETYTTDFSLLQTIENGETSPQRFCSGLLRSNCPHTGQSDWADCYIENFNDKKINSESLLRFLVSFRDTSHYHEETCESVFKGLYDLVGPEIAVGCLYTRRGGIDINPFRYGTTGAYNTSYLRQRVEQTAWAKTARQ